MGIPHYTQFDGSQKSGYYYLAKSLDFASKVFKMYSSKNHCSSSTLFPLPQALQPLKEFGFGATDVTK